jgi:hypothetical protein
VVFVYDNSIILIYCQWACNNVPEMGMNSVPPG